MNVKYLGIKYSFLLLIIMQLMLSHCTYQRNAVSAKFSFEVNGISRNYLFHMPKDLKENTPLVFVLHGYGDSSKGIQSFTKMDSIAEKNGFAVCYPEATIGPDSLRSWNVGYSNYEVDDISYLTELTSFLQKKYKLSAKNTFCTGMSNGGDMTIQMACLKPSVFKAIAPDVGCLMYWLADSMKITEIAPMMTINGTADSITYWEGDKNYPAIGPNGYMSTPQMLNLFVELNECTQVVNDTLPDINKNDGSFVIRQKYKNCKNNEIWAYSLMGGGHDWPGAWGNMDFNASEEIWTFFEQFVE